jgi:hypothetical protein
MLCSELPQPATEQITAAAAALNPLPDAAAGVRPPAEAALSSSSPPLEEGGDQMEEREAGQSGPDLEEANSLPMNAATNGEAEQQTKGCRAVFCCSEMCSKMGSGRK